MLSGIFIDGITVFFLSMQVLASHVGKVVELLFKLAL